MKRTASASIATKMWSSNSVTKLQFTTGFSSTKQHNMYDQLPLTEYCQITSSQSINEYTLKLPPHPNLQGDVHSIACLFYNLISYQNSRLLRSSTQSLLHVPRIKLTLDVMLPLLLLHKSGQNHIYLLLSEAHHHLTPSNVTSLICLVVTLSPPSNYLHL